MGRLTAWALRVEGAAPGEANMARDLALAEAVAAGRCPPTLRLYGWGPPAVSIGRHQDPERACDPGACRAAGWDVVRRPTGGRAVLHAADEVTYAVAVPLALAPAGVQAAYAWIGAALVAAYRHLGLPAELSRGRQLTDRTGACFDAPAAHEVVCQGRKIAGSAQLRHGGFLLQHGSLPLRVDASLHARLLGLDPAAADRLAERAAGLADLCPGARREDLQAAVVHGFREAMGVVLVPWTEADDRA
jgi:lipoate-protein ligase A